jgi:hypothetical protein
LLTITIDLTVVAVPGDCGSWVVDVERYTLCGYVSYGTEPSSVAFIIPAKDILREIQTCIGRRISIGCYSAISLVSHRSRNFRATEYDFGKSQYESETSEYWTSGDED